MSDMRIGRDERDTAITHLREAFAREYLDEDERQNRVEQVLSAKTAGELACITRDLPSLRQLAGRRERRHPARRMLHPATTATRSRRTSRKSGTRSAPASDLPAGRSIPAHDDQETHS
jgi:hypothetical protein